MTPSLQAVFRESLVRVLDENRTRFGLPLPYLQARMAAAGFVSVSEEQLLEALEYLTNHHLVEEVLKDINRANRAWRITTAGIDWLDNQPR